MSSVSTDYVCVKLYFKEVFCYWVNFMVDAILYIFLENHYLKKYYCHQIGKKLLINKIQSVSMQCF